MRPGYLVGTVIGRQPSGEGSNIIVYFKGKQYLVSPENCRPAVGFEHWTPTEEDVEILKHAEEDLREGNLPEQVHDPGPHQDEPRQPELELDPV